MTSSGYNILFVILSGALAHVVPFELLLAVYAFLGPAHYLTEISWLHDKKYFSGNYWLAGAMIVSTALVAFFPEYWDLYIWSALALAISVVSTNNSVLRAIALFAGALIYLNVHEPFGAFSNIVGTLLPTVIHVFIFTSLFILSGFLRGRDPRALVTLGLMMIVSISFFATPDYFYPLWPTWVASNFENFLFIPTALSEALGLTDKHPYFNSVIKFVSFAYTFHYLNWFSKTTLLGWHRIPRRRLMLMVGAYFVFIGTYVYDYTLGLNVLGFLSVLHVVLEFPLNVMTAKSISGSIFSGLKSELRQLPRSSVDGSLPAVPQETRERVS